MRSSRAGRHGSRRDAGRAESGVSQPSPIRPARQDGYALRTIVQAISSFFTQIHWPTLSAQALSRQWKPPTATRKHHCRWRWHRAPRCVIAIEGLRRGWGVLRVWVAVTPALNRVSVRRQYCCTANFPLQVGISKCAAISLFAASTRAGPQHGYGVVVSPCR
jgi:hypothetical protein